MFLTTIFSLTERSLLCIAGRSVGSAALKLQLWQLVSAVTADSCYLMIPALAPPPACHSSDSYHLPAMPCHSPTHTGPLQQASVASRLRNHVAHYRNTWRNRIQIRLAEADSYADQFFVKQNKTKNKAKSQLDANWKRPYLFNVSNFHVISTSIHVISMSIPGQIHINISLLNNVILMMCPCHIYTMKMTCMNRG